MQWRHAGIAMGLFVGALSACSTPNPAGDAGTHCANDACADALASRDDSVANDAPRADTLAPDAPEIDAPTLDAPTLDDAVIDTPAPPMDVPSVPRDAIADTTTTPPDAGHCMGNTLPDGGCSITHVFDLASHMPAHLAVMYSMSWFGLPRTGDPDGAGTDSSYGNWQWGGGCVATNDPRTCAAVGSGPQRVVASRRRPLAGIYSSSGRDDASRKRVDLMLSTLRRPCDSGARLDAWSVQIDSIRFSSLHTAEGSSQYATSADLAYRALVTFFERADAAGMRNAVLPGDDSTWYWNFGDTRGVSTQAARLGALEDDLVDMVQIAAVHPSAVRLGGRLIVYVYTGGSGAGPYISASEWSSVLHNARNRTGQDFYTVGATTNGAYFQAFDAIAPWLESSVWTASTGSTIEARSTDWTRRRHQSVIAALPSYPGRVVWGGVSPGFDDYTRDWGACMDRVIPRDPALLPGEFDYFRQARTAGTDIRGFMLETWDDWTEGSEFEPDVVGGTEKLLQVRQLLGDYFGEASDAAGDTRLQMRWQSYGQARDCTASIPGPGPVTTLTCP